MSRWDRALVWLAVVAVAGSGVGYGLMRYALEPADEWAVVNHPWQPHLQHLHVATAPLLVLAGAVLWREHARRHLAEGRRRGRLTGLAMAGTFLPMVFSGGLIQVAVSDGWRSAWVVVHVVTSLLWLAGLSLHPILRRTSPTDPPEAPPPGAAASITPPPDAPRSPR